MNLLVTGAWRDAETYIPLLQERGNQVAFLPNEAGALPCDPAWVEGVVCNGLFLYHDIQKFTSLRYVQLTSAGFDRVPAAYLAKRGVTLKNARGVYSIPMAEHAVAMTLYFYRNLRLFAQQQKNKVWQKDRNLRELSGRTVCIIGCGSVGTECAKRFCAFGCEVIGLDIDPAEKEGFQKVNDIKNREAVLCAADVVILTLPLTEHTKGMADETFLRSLKDGCLLVNIARGGIIRTDALIKALRERELYAALDVFEEEPLDADSPLWSMENVLITPHNSFVSDKIGDRLSRLIAEGLEAASDSQTDRR